MVSSRRPTLASSALGGKSPFSGHEQQFARALRTKGALIEVGLHLFNLEPAPFEQVLGFKPKKVAHRKCMHDTSLNAIFCDDIVNNLYVDDLLKVISRRDTMPAHDPTPIWQGKPWLLSERLTQVISSQCRDRRVAEI